MSRAPQYLYRRVYTRSIHMEDIFNATILCTSCNQPTERLLRQQEGFELRTAVCKRCKKEFYHPLDAQRFKEFQELKRKEFTVKLRMVGNSHCISIPREMLLFQELEQQLDQLVKLSMGDPDHIIITFKKTRKPW